MYEQFDLFGDLALPNTEISASSQEISWDEEEISILRVNMLYRTLSVLNDLRSTTKSKEESLDWLNSDTIGPFTFRVCCNEAGVDHEELREQITDLVKKQKLH